MNIYQACLQSHANCVVCSDVAQNPHKFTSTADIKGGLHLLHASSMHIEQIVLILAQL